MGAIDEFYKINNKNTKHLNQLDDTLLVHERVANLKNISRHVKNQDRQIYDNMRKKLTNQNINEKARISEINNQDFLKKQLLVNRLMYIIFFILYIILLGVFVSLKVISKQTLTIAFVIGIIYLIYSMFSSTKFLKLYGDVSMDIAKGATKGFIQLAGDLKKCPAECVLHDHVDNIRSSSRISSGSSDGEKFILNKNPILSKFKYLPEETSGIEVETVENDQN